jgi:FMN phosphatase YigB (HAD superfamily)
MYTLSTKGYLLDGVSDMLERLFGKVRMYIITNGVEVIQRGRYARADIGRYFEDIFISETLGYQKPDVRYFELVAKRIEGFNKTETLVVGDSLTADIKGGNAFGVDTCRYDPTRSPISGDIRPTYSAGSFEEICDIILGRNECGE